MLHTCTATHAMCSHSARSGDTAESTDDQQRCRDAARRRYDTSLTRDVLVGVSLFRALLARQTKMHRLVLGVICAGPRNRGEDVERELAVRFGVVDRLALASSCQHDLNRTTPHRTSSKLDLQHRKTAMSSPRLLGRRVVLHLVPESPGHPPLEDQTVHAGVR